MIAVDTNILVYALRASDVRHRRASALLRSLATGSRPLAVPWPCVTEFLCTVTDPRIRPPSGSMALACRNLEVLFASPAVRVLWPTGETPAKLREVLAESGVSGQVVYDAHIVALCIEYGVREILSADKDFRRFTGIKVTNPFR